jgi:hypothetical protein
MAEQLGLTGNLGQQRANLSPEHRQQGGDEGRHGIDVDGVQRKIGSAEVPKQHGLHMVADESTVVVQR